MPDIVLLGPQGKSPTVKRVLRELNIAGPVCTITAGWQERAGELRALRAHLGNPVANLDLYHRADAVFHEDPELFKALRQRQDRLRELQKLYRVRLAYHLDSVRRLWNLSVKRPLLEREIADAIEFVRLLDAHQLSRITEIHQEFEEKWTPAERSAVAQQRVELQQIVESSSAVLVAGGHIATLLNRMRLFEIPSLISGKPLVAWSAGAMAFGEKVVLFHDSPPQGPGNAEVFETGFSFHRNILPLPHARTRLKLGDASRVSLLARRFSPALPLAMDSGAALYLHEDGSGSCEHIFLLQTDGKVQPLERTR